MSDRELLELAAKAIGYKILDWYDDRFRHTVYDGEKSTYWNPLVDDGDALRLAVRLRMEVDAWGAGASAAVKTNGRATVSEPHYGDAPERATRRAIVRAAAEIGKGMAT